MFTVTVLFVHSGISDLLRREVLELGLLHPTTGARGRTRRGDGQCHCGQRQASAAGFTAWRSHRLAGRNILGGIWRKDLLLPGALHHGLAERRAVDCDGIFAYTVVVIPMKHFSAFAGGMALGVMMIPIAVRTTEESLRAVPLVLREGALAWGRANGRRWRRWSCRRPCAAS